MQFMVIGRDGTDPGAKQRRLDARDAHLEGAKKLKAEGKFLAGGAMLNEQGDMIGSTLYLEFESQAELDNWIANDPYTKQGVWKEVETTPIRLVLRD